MERKKSNVTVIIPCYNDGIYLKKAVDSIISQTLKADEIIIVDDGSDIYTKEHLKKINYNNTKIITQKNQGLSKARNNGIALAKTDYILTLDSDDFFEPTFIEKAVELLSKDQKIGIVGCYFRWFDSENNNLRVIKTKGGTVKDFLFSNKGVGNALFRKKCWEQVGGYDEKMAKGYEDWEFWIAITALGWKYQVIEEILFNYRRKDSSMLLTAKANHDLEIKKYIFLKHKTLYALYIENTISHFFERIEEKEKEKYDILNSMHYKFAKIVLFPISLLKRKL